MLKLANNRKVELTVFQKYWPLTFNNDVSQLGDLQRAIPCAHTYLQKNPDDPDMLLAMKEYKNKYDLSGYLTDHEEQPYEVDSGPHQSITRHNIQGYFFHYRIPNPGLIKSPSSFLGLLSERGETPQLRQFQKWCCTPGGNSEALPPRA